MELLIKTPLTSALLPKELVVAGALPPPIVIALPLELTVVESNRTAPSEFASLSEFNVIPVVADKDPVEPPSP